MSAPASLFPRRQRFSNPATTAYAVVTTISFSASSSAPTPLYHLYQRLMDLSSLTVTLIFASYAFTMVATFLTVARLSDHLGRRPMILVALFMNAVSLVLFVIGGSVAILIAARLVQGVAIGIGMTTLGATILDTDRLRGPILNSVTAFVGLTVGSLLGGALVSWAPFPMHLVFIVLLIIMLTEAIALILVPETITRKAGAWRALVPNVSIPAAALPEVLRLSPLTVASWALGGFYLSLMPTLVSVATGTRSIFISAAVVPTLMATAAATVIVRRHTSARRLLGQGAILLATGVAITLAGVTKQSVVLMMLGTLIAGVGFGSSYSGSFRTLLPLAMGHERAGLLAAYFVLSYLAFAIPTVLAGFGAPTFGLIMTSKIYGLTVIALALLSRLPGVYLKWGLSSPGRKESVASR